ncbi:thiol:disulfide interchange protein DsbC [Thiothrix caldifontis]|jgi:Protein-disulfide isomerase|uniref:Thiol:disulfide interchange protein n=1 Tax=Thiothrix caldifontis TaxID=525918 RepID=A0A1H4DGH5_9GAMM|nr:DsbC family protein [Thiothrix caldifontis]SEA71933.1 thiol:disulfide interchange protein DsbC [Thiothrix caldifontis]
MYKKMILGALIGMALATTGAMADDVPADLGEKLKPMFGGQAPDSLKPTPLANLFEAKFGGEIIYVSGDARYVFAGELIDAQTKSSLTEASRSADRVAIVKTIDAGKSIEFKAKGEEKHVLYAFTDVDCPFCVKLHKEVPALNEKGVTVRYLAYPRAGVGSPAYKKMANIWCADDKQAAMNQVKNDGKEVAAKECTNPVAEQFELGQKLGVNGTPALLTMDGMMIPGYRPADQLAKMLDDAKAAAAK